jgi:flagellar motor switch protein FliN/FliY
VESAEAQEVKDTWFEILGQSFPAVAREAGLLWRREVVLEPGRKDLPAAASGARMSAGLEFPGEPPRGLSLVFGEALLAALSTPQENSPEEQEAQPGSEPEPAGPSGLPGAPSPTLDLLLGIELPVSISFGKKRLPLRDVLKLTTGSIVELDRDVDEPVEILVNQCLIARGEVVVVQGNYGVRIQEIASRAERLRSLP